MNVGGPPGALPPQGPATPKTGSPPTQSMQGAPGTSQPQAAPQSQQPMAPGNLAMRLPQGFNPPGGTLLFAQVAGKDGQGYLMRMGEHLIRARSGTPLEVGQSLQLRVENQTQGNNFTLQMMPQGATARHSAGDIAASLSNLKMPISENSMETAKAMVESKVPLTKDNLQSMQQATQMPEGSRSAPPMQTRVAAVVFLQQNQLPVTPQNMSSVANFLAQNPQIGQQMAAMNDELRRLATRGNDSKGFEAVREMVLEAIDAGSGGANLGKIREKRVPPKKFYNAAKQAGIEFGPGPFPGGGGEDEWEILAAYRELRRKTGSLIHSDEHAREFAQLLEETEQNLQAQQLLNKSVLGEIGCLYFQVPLRLDRREDAEVWLYFRRRKGRGQDDLGDEFRAEFLVTTEHLGALFFIVEVAAIDVSVVVEVEEERVLGYVQRFTPVLEERIAAAGWRCAGVSAIRRKTVPGNPWVAPQESLNEMVSYDVQA